jgi:hypothetical protein
MGRGEAEEKHRLKVKRKSLGKSDKMRGKA